MDVRFSLPAIAKILQVGPNENVEIFAFIHLFLEFGRQSDHLSSKGSPPACRARPAAISSFNQRLPLVIFFNSFSRATASSSCRVFFIMNYAHRLVCFEPIGTSSLFVLATLSRQVIGVSDVDTVIVTPYRIYKKASGTRRRQVVFNLGRADVASGRENVVVMADIIERGAL